MTYVAYVHARPNTTTAAGIFYVGKGTRKRSSETAPSRRSEYHQRIIAKHGKENILVGRMECSSEAIAFDLERGLIKCLRRMGVELVNHTDGGEGASGNKHTAEAKAKMSATQSARYTNVAVREAVAIRTAKQMADPENRAKVAEAMRTRVVSPETLARMSASMKALCATPEYKAKLSALRQGKKQPLETIAKRANTLRVTMSTPEWKAAQSARLKARWASPQFKQKMAAAMAGRQAPSMEVRAATSIAMKAVWAKRKAKA